MGREFGNLIIFLPRSIIRITMPVSFRRLYPKTTIITDCTDCFHTETEKVHDQGKKYFYYKSHNTRKVLMGIAPSAYLCSFLVFGGRASYMFETSQLSFHDYILPGDQS